MVIILPQGFKPQQFQQPDIWKSLEFYKHCRREKKGKEHQATYFYNQQLSILLMNINTFLWAQNLHAKTGNCYLILFVDCMRYGGFFFLQFFNKGRCITCQTVAVEVVVAISFKKPIAFTKVFKTNGALTVWNISFCQAVLGHLETNVKELCTVKKNCILKEVQVHMWTCEK